MLGGQRLFQCRIGDAQSTVVGRVFAQCQPAIQKDRLVLAFGRSGLKAAVLVGYAIGALGEGFAVGCRPPLAHVALCVELRAFVVEAVRHLMSDDHADGAIVDRRIDGEIEKWRLQDTGREVDVVERRIVIGVDRRRRHAPLFFVDRLAQLSVVVIALVDGALVQIFNVLFAIHLYARIVAPLFRVADLVADRRQLDLGGLPRLLAHPRQRLDVFAQRFFERGHQLVHALLGGGRKVLSHPVLAHGLAQSSIGRARAPLPARLRKLLPAERLGEEGEVLIEESLGQFAGLSVQRVPAQIALPGRYGLIFEQRVEAGEKLRHADVEGIEVADADCAKVGRPVELGRRFLEVGYREDVVSFLRVAHLGTAHGCLGQRGFDFDHGGGLFAGLLGSVASQHEHFFDVFEISGANLNKARRRVEIVVAVGLGD